MLQAWLSSALWEKWLEQRFVRWSLRIGFAAAVTILLTQLKLDPIEFILYDWRAALVEAPASSGHIVLIGIDDKTVSSLHRNPNAAEFATAIKKLQGTHPASTVTLVRPAEFLGTPEELVKLAEAATGSGLVFAENDLPAPGQKKLEELPPPFDRVRVEAAPLTHDHSLFTPRGVSRRVIVRYQGAWTLQAKLAQPFNGLAELDDYRGLFHYLDSDQVYVRYRSGFPHISFLDVMNGNFDPESLRGRILLIGRDSAAVAQTFLTAPTSTRLSDKSPLEVQANYIDTLVTNSAPRTSPGWCTAILTFLLSLLTMWIVMRFRPVKGLMALVASVGCVIMFSLFVDFAFNWFFQVAAPVFGILVCYYFILPYRLILENRKSWEYLEKNRLLTQVEELKSNFIRLMSHDLKTPIARIQAMAEIAMHERENLSDEQLQAIENITASSEELSQFIASILNLSRIESKKVKLQVRTRDINQLLQRVIQKCLPLAQRKNIAIATEFEPLFSLKMDEDLMRQVFTNLLENAIKYSPENTRVKVSAREIEGRIKVQISDQGIGIPEDELPSVFERFYRAQNAEYEHTGTGLGLYLAKYFVQLHKGTIEVQSQAHVGSTFSVNLPLDMEDGKGAANV